MSNTRASFLLILCGLALACSGTSACTDYAGYMFVKHYDQVGGDIGYTAGNINGARDSCNLSQDCVSFNTQGFFKRPLGSLTYKPEYVGCDGIYIKH